MGGGYYLNSRAYSQFKWSKKEKNNFGAKKLIALEKTDIRILEFVTAVLAVYVERKRLKGTTVQLCIDNSGAWKWLTTRKMTHLWGKGWMSLLDRVCADYDIDIVPVCISGVENPVADALSRYKSLESGSSKVSMLKGLKRMTSPCSKWRELVWTGANKQRQSDSKAER